MCHAFQNGGLVLIRRFLHSPHEAYNATAFYLIFFILFAGHPPLSGPANSCFYRSQGDVSSLFVVDS